MLDAQAGIQYRGEEPPEPTDADLLALRVWNMLANGMGGIDWAGLPLAVELFGIADVDVLLHRLQVIKAHNPPKRGDAPQQPADAD